VSTRPVVAAEPREVHGKHLNALRRQGIVPAVVYGHGRKSQSIQLEARAFDDLRRTATRNSLVDLKIGSGRALPVLLQGIQEHPVKRHPIHVDFFVVKMTEELQVDVPITFVGESQAVDKLGGTLLHLREHITVRALPADLPHAIELDISSLDGFEAVLHVRDLVVPTGVTVLVDPDESLALVQPPRALDVPVAAPEVAAPAGAETAQAGASEVAAG
jgi:large subunit ribosomal protein L25